MSSVTDQNYLKNDQYRDASNLNVRIALHQRFGTGKIGLHRWAFDQFDLPPDAHVLELGCGPGQLWAENMDRVPAGWQITLSDLSLGMVEQARKNLTATHYTFTFSHSFTFAECDAQEIPFADASFDAVIANHMLYHVPDRQKTYAEVRRVLKPQGRFYAAANSQDSMKQIADLEASLGIVGSLRAFAGSANFFKLENGGAELAAWFPSVELRRLEDVLAVTEAQPLIDYILSFADGAIPTNDKVEELKAAVEQEIRNKGAFHVDKVSGMFVATRE